MIRGLASAAAVRGSDGIAMAGGASGGMASTTLVPDAGRGVDKSPATPAAKDNVLSANAAATMRMSDDPTKAPHSTESALASRRGATRAPQLSAKPQCPD